MTRPRTTELTAIRLGAGSELCFGAPRELISLTEGGALAFFAPGAIFCALRTAPGPSGKAEYALLIAATGASGARVCALRSVAPGADPLVAAFGRRRVKRVLAVIAAIEKNGFSPSDISPFYWRRIGCRVSTEAEFAPYSKAQHAAHLKCKALVL